MSNSSSGAANFAENYFIDEIPTYGEGPISGVYLIKHLATGKMYVGSSNNLYRRINQHKSMLSRGEHYSQDLQKAYDADKEIHISVKRLSNVTTSLDREQDLLDQLQKDKNLVNIAKNARNSFQGLKHTEETKKRISEAKIGSVVPSEIRERIRSKMMGRVITQEAREKLRIAKTGISRPVHVQTNLHKANELKAVPVTIDGVEYSSVSAAARAFNVDPKTVYNRISSQTPRFKGWNFSRNRETE